MRVQNINSKTIRDLAGKWREAPRRSNRKSFEREWQLLHRILTFYKEEVDEGGDYGIPSFKKARKLTTFNPTAFVPRVLEDEELFAFLEGLSEEKDPYQDMAYCQFYLGSRVGEICALHVDQVDFDREEVFITRTIHWDMGTWIPSVKEYTKNKHHRVLKIPQPLIGILKNRVRMASSTGLLFYDKKGLPINRKTLGTVYNRVLKKFDLKRYVSGTHFLRRQAATKIQEITGDINTTKIALGHSSSRVTERYIANTEKQRVSAANALGSFGDTGNIKESFVKETFRKKVFKDGFAKMDGGESQIGKRPTDFCKDVPQERVDGGSSYLPVPQCPTRGLGRKLKLVKSDT